MVVNALIFLGTLAGMEVVAYLSHRYLMHGPLWFLHASHHRPRGHWFEWNDLFGVIFATPSIVLIWLGVNVEPHLLWVGLGMAAYGVVYFGFHDVIVHQRIRFRRIPRFGYLRRIVQAHRLHHAIETKEDGVSFGFLYAPPVDRLKPARAIMKSSHWMRRTKTPGVILALLD